MKKQNRILILLLLLLIVLSSTGIAFSYWDNLNPINSEELPIGEWYEGISTAQEFYDFATRKNSTSEDRYYLENDIDFTGFVGLLIQQTTTYFLEVYWKAIITQSVI